ncbi:MAG: hypothetical protein IT383_08005 [Deltaproteobacteria bacterium]|nr:hypothetical protein [Deltaproteobacteria bacterium]
MVFNSKQLEELESIHDSTGAFEEEADDDAFSDDVGEAAMDWRRGLIEEAAENIKRARGRPVEANIHYPIGSMLFDRDVRRFGRVQRSVPGYLKIAYLAGGDREYGNLDLDGYLREYGARRRLSELSEQLGLPDGEVGHELERMGIVPLEEPEVVEAPAPAEAAAPPPPFARAARPATEGDVAGTQAPAAAQATAKPTGKAGKAAPPTTPKAAAPAKAAAKPTGKPAPATGKPAPASGKAANPIDDPNGYIKANYQAMSNRELARLTGLSEHTIRRKLGEWSLKRKKD